MDKRARLEFDRGTVICASWPEGVDHRVLSMRWDDRVGCHRSPACAYPAIEQALARARVPCADAVRAVGPEPETMSMPSLRPYQEAALNAWTLADRRGIVVLPTGSGKTRLAQAAIAQLRCRTLCLVPTRVLLDQWCGELGAVLAIAAGRYGDGVRDVRPVTVATFESAYRHMHELGNRFDLLIVDEVHHFGGGARDEALEMSIAPHRLGLTATMPSADASTALERLIGPRVFEMTIADLAGGYLADFELIDVRLELSAAERERYEELHDRFSCVFDRFRALAPGAPWDAFVRWAGRTETGRHGLRAWREGRRLLGLTAAKSEMVGALLRTHRSGRTIVFTADKEAAYRIARQHLIMPITADIKRGERDAMLASFRVGAIRALVSARVLNEGLDVPDADVAIVVSGALGLREHVQRVGRVLRPGPGKRALVYDLVSRGTNESDRARRRRDVIASSRPAAL